jgi:hypothetical protein
MHAKRELVISSGISMALFLLAGFLLCEEAFRYSLPRECDLFVRGADSPFTDPAETPTIARRRREIPYIGKLQLRKSAWV